MINYEFTVFFRDINFHAVIVEKQLIKQDILTHCLTCNFHHMSQYNSFLSVLFKKHGNLQKGGFQRMV